MNGTWSTRAVAVELGLTPDGQWEIELGDLVDVAGGAGFAALGLVASRAGADAAATYAGAGLRCHELLALVVGEDGASTVRYAERLAEAAALVRAEWVLTTFQVGLSADTAKVIERCAAMFVDAGAAMAVEFSPLGPVPSISDGLDVVRAAGAGRAALMIDTWHFSFGDSTWEDLAAVPLEEIAYVQFADAPPPLSDDRMYETMNRRALPGDGVLELDRFASTLLERGWEGLVSVEVLNEELRATPVRDFARRAYEATARYWS
jgi:sugar phosphate isomerase/epimerase